MAVLQVVGDRPQTGKTCLISSLLLRLAEADRPVRYYKPFAKPFAPSTDQNLDQDPDVAFVSGQLLGNPATPPPRSRPPAGANPSIPEADRQEFLEAVAGLGDASSTIFVEGPDLRPDGPDGAESPLATELADLLDARVILTVGYAKGLEAASIARMAANFGDRLAGVVINNVSQHRRQVIQQGVIDELRSQNLPVAGLIPEDRSMLAVTVQQIADYLGARWVQEPVHADAWVDRFLIGGNILDSGVNYLGRYPNQAVITRAERPDIQMASLMTATKCLVLTGGSEPIEYIRVEAAKRQVPLLLVAEDTLTAAEALGGLLDQAHPYDRSKAQRFGQLVEQHLDRDWLNSVLAIP